MELKKTTKYDGKLKDVHFEDGELLDSCNESIDILDLLHKAYGNQYFTITTSTKIEEVIDLDDMDSEDI